MSLWTEVFVIHLLPRGLVRLVVRVFTFRAFGGYCLPSANQNYFHICAVRAYAGSSSICKATLTSMYFFDTFTNYVGTQNEFKTKLKIDFKLCFHDLSGFGVQYWSIWLSGGCLGLPWGTLRSPWVARVPPTGVQGAKSWFVGHPPGLPK